MRKLILKVSERENLQFMTANGEIVTNPEKAPGLSKCLTDVDITLNDWCIFDEDIKKLWKLKPVNLVNSVNLMSVIYEKTLILLPRVQPLHNLLRIHENGIYNFVKDSQENEGIYLVDENGNSYNWFENHYDIHDSITFLNNHFGIFEIEEIEYKKDEEMHYYIATFWNRPSKIFKSKSILSKNNASEVIRILISEGKISDGEILDYAVQFYDVKEISEIGYAYAKDLKFLMNPVGQVDKNGTLIMSTNAFHKTFDGAFVRKSLNEGIDAFEISSLLNHLKETNVIPLEIQGEFKTAIGFITLSAAKKLNYAYDELSAYIVYVLNNVNEAGTCILKELNIMI